jgi:hypothetical protein
VDAVVDVIALSVPTGTLSAYDTVFFIDLRLETSLQCVDSCRKPGNPAANYFPVLY